MSQIKSALYWRKSKFNGRKCVPAILTAAGDIGSDGDVSGGTLELRDADGGGFTADAGAVTAAFSKLGTLTLTVDGQKYDIVGVAAPASPKFSEGQLQELRDAAAQAESVVGPTAERSSIWGGGVIGGVGALSDAAAIKRNMAPLKELLPALGVKTG